MHKLDRILLATDFSESAENAGKLAADLALTCHAELHVFFAHVTPPIQWSGALGEGSGTAIAAMDQSSYEANKDRLERYAPSHFVKLKIDKAIQRVPSVTKGVLTYAKNHDIDLVSVGTHGRKGLPRFFLGSTAAEILRFSPVPVLVASAGHHPPDSGFRSVLATIDFSDSSLSALQEAGRLAEAYKATLLVAHVIDDQAGPSYIDFKEFEQSARTRAWSELNRCIDTARLAVDAEPILAHGAAHKKILDIAREHDVDLLVMGTTGRSRLERFLVGSVTEHVIRTAPCPVLAHRDWSTP